MAEENPAYKNQKTSNIIGLERGKIPPQALDLEEAVLGALMIDKKGLDEAIDILEPDFFYKIEHQEIYETIKTLFNDSQPIDILTVSNALKQKGKLDQIGGDYYLVQLTQKVSSAAHIEYHSRIIQQKYIQRRLIQVSSQIIDKSYDETTDVFDLLDDAENKLFEITNGNLKKTSERADRLVAQAIDKIKQVSEQEGLSGVPSGFTKIDQLTAGWQRSDLIILAARPGMGKCLGKGTKILMYDGSLKKVEDVKENDLLMGDDSTPRKVLSIDQGSEKMYWIRQNKGIDYRVNESHILSLKRSRNEGIHQKGSILNISVKDYLKKSDKFKSNYKGYKVAVQFPKKEVKLSPYFLGLWLGDGHSLSPRITTTDHEIIDFLEHYANQYNWKLNTYKQKNRTNNYSIVSTIENRNTKTETVSSLLKKLNLYDNKHIPTQYIINSEENRLELLAGLIDSDGYYDDNANCYEIVQKRTKLSKQIKFLCDSLGFRTSLKKKKATIADQNFESEVFRIRIFGDIKKIPVKIKRKKARSRISNADWKVTGISVEYDKVDDYYGFEIDGNRLFLLEDMTVTHNTAFVLSMAKNIAIQYGKGVAIFSLEMSSVQLVTRLISGETGIDSEKLRKANLVEHEWEQLYSKVKKLEDAPLYIDDTPALSIFDLRAKCRRLVSQHNVECIIVDYLQLMTTGSNHTGNREQEISMISRSLKSIAKELDVPVIALSQLSRAVETRGGSKRPLLSDLRESGAIEQDADIVCFIYRPEYYGLTEWDDEELSPCTGQGEFIVAKHRNGGLDSIRLRFIGAQAKFDNLEDNPFITSGLQSFESSMNELPNPSPTDAFDSNDDTTLSSGMNADEDDFPF